MAKDLLLEIGLEEIPANLVTPSRLQLEERIVQFLNEQRLTYETIQTFSTSRRLAVYVSEIPDEQEDIYEEVKGPAKKIALDNEGNWTKAAQGFARGQGVETDAIIFRELMGIEYAYITKYIKGQAAVNVLTGLKEIILSMTFPVTMRWSNYDLDYIRPIHWITALFGEQVIPFSILNVQTNNISQGHRSLGDQIIIRQASDYQTKLSEQFVIADPKERKRIIQQQMEEISQKNNWHLIYDEALLEEVTNLVEYPTAFVGNFSEKYLAIPKEILITSMKDHQRYFEVYNHEGDLLPHFISVRNGDQVHLKNVIQGNEKVLVARLEDAEFFYNEDKKLSITTCVNKLKQVTFHDKIGTIYEKMQRVCLISQIIGKKVGLTKTELLDLKRASEIYKFDLVTNVVNEFPELQGIMGEKYALLHGEKPNVAQAIREHYLPISSEGELPTSIIGSVLAVADKLDSVFSFFAKDMIPSGSNDPYALRRQTYGIIRIVAENKWEFPIIQLQKEIYAAINAKESFGIKLNDDNMQVVDFIKGRIRQLLSSEHFRHDIIDAVISSEQQDLLKLLTTAKTLRKHLADDDFKASIEALTRVINLAEKDKELMKEPILTVELELFENNSEEKLYEAVQKISANFDEQTIDENYDALMNLRILIENYFDQTMVMTEDKAIKNNRLKQLLQIAQMASSIARFDLLITK